MSQMRSCGTLWSTLCIGGGGDEATIILFVDGALPCFSCDPRKRHYLKGAKGKFKWQGEIGGN